ncbi:hypothetical protein C8F01DRAFT_1192495 [Mycena amicta]|nr:hypothetical protein C8F01DRAFT_1192495 [Mycena amicta]
MASSDDDFADMPSLVPICDSDDEADGIIVSTPVCPAHSTDGSQLVPTFHQVLGCEYCLRDDLAGPVARTPTSPGRSGNPIPVDDDSDDALSRPESPVYNPEAYVYSYIREETPETLDFSRWTRPSFSRLDVPIAASPSPSPSTLAEPSYTPQLADTSVYSYYMSFEPCTDSAVDTGPSGDGTASQDVLIDMPLWEVMPRTFRTEDSKPEMVRTSLEYLALASQDYFSTTFTGNEAYTFFADHSRASALSDEPISRYYNPRGYYPTPLVFDILYRQEQGEYKAGKSVPTPGIPRGICALADFEHWTEVPESVRRLDTTHDLDDFCWLQRKIYELYSNTRDRYPAQHLVAATPIVCSVIPYSSQYRFGPGDPFSEKAAAIITEKSVLLNFLLLEVGLEARQAYIRVDNELRLFQAKQRNGPHGNDNVPYRHPLFYRFELDLLRAARNIFASDTTLYVGIEDLNFLVDAEFAYGREISELFLRGTFSFTPASRLITDDSHDSD